MQEIDEHEWRSSLNIPAKSEISTYEVQIHGLKPATEYIIGVIVVDESENKQEAGIKSTSVVTDCDSNNYLNSISIFI